MTLAVEPAAEWLAGIRTLELEVTDRLSECS